jgi:membrane protein DedA with SNARE-associated domain
MPALGGAIGHWGYFAICIFVILGNLGLPVPEESILVLAGYLIWHEKLRLLWVLVVGVLSAVAGDNLGFWVGRRFGQDAIERYGHWVLVTPDRLHRARGFMTRYGSYGVFAARFVAGLRFLAGPLAGSTGLRPHVFLVANTLGALIYVPAVVGAGYAIGYGLGDYVRRIEHVWGDFEEMVLISAIIATLGFVGRRALQAARMRKG